MPTTRMSVSALSRLLDGWMDTRPTLTESLEISLIELIESGFVPAGITLPPQRDLANSLGVSRGTVATALKDLEAGGYLVLVQGSGARVRSGRGRSQTLGEGRYFSLTNAPADVFDFSTGALPASKAAARILEERIDDVTPYLDTDGYFPAGIPVLRQGIAEQLTREGIPTKPQQILVTSGAQQAMSLVLNYLASPGDLAIVEDPTYRGVLEALRTCNARAEGVPLTQGGIDVDLVRQSLRRKPRLLYCQTTIHNPSGQTMHPTRRRELAEVINASGLRTVEDCCYRDVTFHGDPPAGLSALVNPDLLLMVGTFSKLFWGGLRIGWVRAEKPAIRALTQMRKTADIATPIIDQLYAFKMLSVTEEARTERREDLLAGLASSEKLLRKYRPSWTWKSVAGGTGLWVDTGIDTIKLTKDARQRGIKLSPGPTFSPHEGHRTMLRLPLWHQPSEIEHVFETLKDVGKA